MLSSKKKKGYQRPKTSLTVIGVETGFMDSSVFNPVNENDKGLTTEEHDFANPGQTWEGDFSTSDWE